ncbi:MAG: PQQ-binding-like beta-propeller repeat protein, partial [Lachnospiraceae bacterium]
MFNQRSYLKIGTRVSLPCGNTYEIIGEPIGNGGGSIVYPVERIYEQNGEIIRDGIKYALKECYPVSAEHTFIRNENGEILPEQADPGEIYYLNRVKEMQLNEKDITQTIYRTGSRLLPILESGTSANIQIPTYDDGISESSGRDCKVENTYTVMESLSSKGKSLHSYIEEYGALTPIQTFHIIKQLLFSLREIHNAGFLHLDIQDGNIFLKGTLEDESDIVTLIDFGSARELIQGKTNVISDKVIFITQGFSAPEIILHNDGTLQLGPEADIYSVGCLILYLLTGKRFDVNYLIHNTSGKYLTNFKLRKISCPRHLIDRMQEIIAHALEVDPEKRYRSADEMLEDVTEFIRALQPYRSDLASVSYDAFICYKHGETDTAVARMLQRQLEHFRVPRKVPGQRYPFKRVFVDEGELSSCSDFGEQVCDALKNSGWLIVICSPETPLSPWVKLEIDTFLKFHDRSRVLAILTSGEPEMSFPPQLLGDNEVLAADARGGTLKDVLKKLKGDALLKIAAPMLGITFDSLKQRQKIYHYQQIACISSIFMTIALAFSFYAYRQAKIISNQAAELSEEYNRNLLSQSEYYVKEAEELIDNNNNIIGAIEKLLMALPDETNDRPILSDAVYLLTNVLNVYKSDYDVQNTVTPVDYFSLTDDMESEYCFDESGEYFFTSNRRTIWVRAADTFELVQTINVPSDHYIMSFPEDFFVKSGEQIIYCDDKGSVYCVNYLTGEEIWTNSELVSESEAENKISVILSDDETLLAVAISGKLYILDVDTGDVRDSYEYSVQGNPDIKEYMKDEYQIPEMGDEMAFSTDNRYVAFTTSQWESSGGYYDYPNYIYITDLKEHTVTVLEDSINSIRKMRISGDHILIMGSDAQTAIVNNQNIDYIGETTIYSYNISNGRKEWSTSVENAGRSYHEMIKVIESPFDSFDGKVVFAACYDTVVALSYEDGQMIQEIEYSDPIVALDISNKDMICAIHSNGYFSWCEYNSSFQSGKETVIYQALFSNNIVDLKYAGGYYYTTKYTDVGIRLNSPKAIIKYQIEKADSTYQKMIVNKTDRNIFGYYEPLENGWAYMIEEHTLYLTDCNNAQSYEFELPLNNGSYLEDYRIECLGFSEDYNIFYLYYEGSVVDKSISAIYTFDIEAGTVMSCDFPWDEDEEIKDVVFEKGRVFCLTLKSITTNYADRVSEGEDGKAEDISIYDVVSYNGLNLYEWYPEDDSVELLCEIDLEEDEGDNYFTSEDFTKDYGKAKTKYEIEAYLSDSMVLSDDNKKISLGIEKNNYTKEGDKASVRFVNFDLENKRIENIPSVIMTDQGIYEIISHIVNEEENINAIVYIERIPDNSEMDEKLLVFDTEGKVLFTEENSELERECEKIFFSKDGSLLWVIYKESKECELVAYDSATGEVRTKINLLEYANESYATFEDCSVQWISDTVFLLYNGSNGFIIDEECSSMGVVAYIDD